MHQPLSAILNRPVCDEHFPEIKLSDLLSDDIRQIFEIAARGKQPPDFPRAFLSKVSLSSAEYNLFARAAADNGT